MKTLTLRHRGLSAIVVTALAAATFSSTVMAQSGTRSNQTMQPSASHQGMMKARVGLQGYCPVCIIAKQKWEKGDPRITSKFDGVTYYFPGQSIKQMFDASPEKFVPALNGDCIVCYEKMGKRVPGSIQYAAMRNKRLYLFPSEKEKAMFVSGGAAFDKTDLAANGECIVCLAKMGKHVPGSPEHTVIHNGFRYLFPSPSEAAMFRQSPEKFVTGVQAMQKKEMLKTSLESASSNTVRVAGRSGCAACEFGVTPLAAPDQLGLAILGQDGQVTVVEGAHSQYPGIYKDRFQGQQLIVEGTVLKSTGNVSWIRSTSLKVIH